MNLLLARSIRKIVQHYPGVIPSLKGAARWIAFASPDLDISSRHIDFQTGNAIAYGRYTLTKTYDYFLEQIERLIRSVYAGNLGGEFIDIMANLISGQITQAVNEIWLAEGFDQIALPDYLQDVIDRIVLDQYIFVDQLYRDIIDARVDGTALDPLLARAPMWANRYTEAQNQALLAIAAANGEKLRWTFGGTIEHCEDCARLEGIVDYAESWAACPHQPQGRELACGGFNCQCSFEQTEARRSPGGWSATA